MGFHFRNLLLDCSVVAVHLPDPALSPMTISLHGLRSAIDRPNGSLRAVNAPSHPTPPTCVHTVVPSSFTLPRLPLKPT